MTNTMDWAALIGRHDMKWAQTPLCRPESPETMMRGAFLGNGTLGALVYASDEPCDFPHHALRVDIGRADVADKGGQRTDGGMWWDKWNCQNKGTRLHTGGFMLWGHGLAKVQPMTLDLYQAECRAAVSTKHQVPGSISMRVLVAATRQVIVAECLLTGDEVIPSFLNTVASADIMRAENLDYSNSCRPRFVRRAMPFPGWPPAKNSVTDDGIIVEVQPLLDGKEYAVAWTEVLAGDKLYLYCSLGVSPSIKSLSMGSDDTRSATDEAIEAVRSAREAGLAAIEAEHRAWWSARWQQSAIAIPDARLESFYTIQIYKFLSSTRAGAPIPDATGPWSYAMGGPDDWAHCPGYPHVWLNFNLQMHCLIGNVSGHAGQLATVAERLLAWALRQPEWQQEGSRPLAIGGGASYDLEEGHRRPIASIHLIWLLHNCWLAARHDGSEKWAARWNKLLPVLAAAANDPLARLKEGADGKLHLLNSDSPEYPVPPKFQVNHRQAMTDATYELAFTRWALEQLCTDLPKDPRATQWKAALANMTGFPVDIFGLRISADLSHDVGHRHYSHLVMLWPLRLWNWDDSGKQELIARSIGTWLGCPPDGKKRTGFTWAAAANICAHIGRGDWAWGHMDTYFEELPRGTARRFQNTMAREWGFILETPLGIGNAVTEMLLQSHGGRIRIFPAIPDAWQASAFHNLSAEGGWKVSAGRQDGATAWVRVEATVPGSIRLRHGIAQALVETDGMEVVHQADGECGLSATAGGARILLRAPEVQNPVFGPVAHAFHPTWRWGEPKP
ncbi:MAG: glycoside hydrolase family 95-like protein [bacterium]